MGGHKRPWFECSGEEIIFHTTEKPERGKVNLQLIKTLKTRLRGSSVSNIMIAKGEKSRYKTIVFELENRMDKKEDLLSLICGGH